MLEVRLDLDEWMDRLGMDRAFAERHLNEGFSGGERKRNEILQMAMLEPDLALLDETDSGLDIDALRVVAHGVRTVRERRPQMGVLIVTHYASSSRSSSPTTCTSSSTARSSRAAAPSWPGASSATATTRGAGSPP